MVGMRNAFARTNPLSLLHSLPRVRDLKDARTRDVVVLLLYHVHDLGHVLGRKSLVTVHCQKGGLQVIGREVAVRASMRVAWARLVGHQDLLAAVKRMAAIQIDTSGQLGFYVDSTQRTSTRRNSPAFPPSRMSDGYCTDILC